MAGLKEWVGFGESSITLEHFRKLTLSEWGRGRSDDGIFRPFRSERWKDGEKGGREVREGREGREERREKGREKRKRRIFRYVDQKEGSNQNYQK
ncbi:hypothetical protein EYC84_009189 [Monilinia fructicola]|uniref:Uncharacterized protein n=1 Tax=Monilinia fructicola TaxID=38448 RepID=A0A5M9JBL5_MONFR|nr:hypothetical protein EYC84_009189 [Monilinia fructicola]